MGSRSNFWHWCLNFGRVICKDCTQSPPCLAGSPKHGQQLAQAFPKTVEMFYNRAFFFSSWFAVSTGNRIVYTACAIAERLERRVKAATENDATRGGRRNTEARSQGTPDDPPLPAHSCVTHLWPQLFAGLQRRVQEKWEATLRGKLTQGGQLGARCVLQMP